MTIAEFVRAIKIQTSDAAVDGTIQSLVEPPGRRPPTEFVQLSAWYQQLDSKDQAMLREALRLATEMAVFEFLCILDGVSVIEETAEKGNVELYLVRDAERIRLNDPGQQELHNVYNRLCAEKVRHEKTEPIISAYESGRAQDLISKLKPGDNLDIHHVPDKYSSLQTIEGYDPKSGSAIAIPKNEHHHIPPGR